jgi:quercetin dioxygenase-like cupin family protein
LTSNLRTVDELEFQQVWAGVRGRVIEGERITVAVVELEPNGVVPGHEHPHEQMGLVIRGQVTFTVGEETRTFGPGGTWRIPSTVPHDVKVGPDGATVVDIFNPIRADWHDRPTAEDQVAYWP